MNMIARILQTNYYPYFCITDTGTYAFLFLGEDKTISLSVGDFVEVSMIKFDDDNETVHLLYEGAVDVSNDYYKKIQSIFFLPCEMCKKRLEKTVGECGRCSPQPRENEK
jgi:hypothetical protein